MKLKAVTISRASSSKQAVEGDPLENQEQQCRDYIQKQGWEFVRSFCFVESGAIDERHFFQEVLTYCLDKKNNVDVLVFKHINRVTRLGSTDYLSWKSKLENAGIRITDIYNTIGEKVNTLDHLGFHYTWSEFSPTEGTEIEIAEQAKADRRNILTQTIGAEIIYTNKGYWCRQATYGFKLEKIQTSDGKRCILFELKNESFFVKEIFKLKAEDYTESNIAKHINNLGFKSRPRCKRDSRTKKIVGHLGSIPATKQTVSEILKRTIYTGIICEKWTKFQPIKAQFNGFIDIELFNRANKNRIFIELINNVPTIKYGKEATKEFTKERRSRNNPLYPFKNVVKCPVCLSKLSGSASTGQNGNKYPAYHCNKNHKRWKCDPDEFNETVYKYIRQIRFDEGVLNIIENSFYEKWDAKRKEVLNASEVKEKYVAQLITEQINILESIKLTSSQAVRKGLENNYEQLEEKINNARAQRDKQVKKELNAKLAFKYARYFMENIDELLIDRENMPRQQQLFAMMFDELPTYTQLLNGTANLNAYFKLNMDMRDKIESFGEPEHAYMELLTPAFEKITRVMSDWFTPTQVNYVY